MVFSNFYFYRGGDLIRGLRPHPPEIERERAVVGLGVWGPVISAVRATGICDTLGSVSVGSPREIMNQAVAISRQLL